MILKFIQVTNVFQYLITILLLCIVTSCVSKPKGVFNPENIENAPDYSLSKYWSALPDMEDNADLVPAGLKDEQSSAKADVFY